MTVKGEFPREEEHTKTMRMRDRFTVSWN